MLPRQDVPSWLLLTVYANLRRKSRESFRPDRYSENVGSQTTPHQTRRTIWRFFDIKEEADPILPHTAKSASEIKRSASSTCSISHNAKESQAKSFCFIGNDENKKETAVLHAPRFASESPLSDTVSTIRISHFANNVNNFFRPPSETQKSAIVSHRRKQILYSFHKNSR